MPLNKSGKKLKKIFEKEYEAKGKTKAESDQIFYKYERKHKLVKKSRR
jgi:hypothetical protein